MTDFMVCSEFGLKHYKAGENSDEGVFASAKKVSFRFFFENFIFFQFLHEILNKIAKKRQIRININLQ